MDGQKCFEIQHAKNILILVTLRKQYLRINAELILKLEAHMRYTNEQYQGQSIAHGNKKDSIIIT